MAMYNTIIFEYAMNIADYATEQTGGSMEKIHDLQTQLIVNVIEIDALCENLEKLTLQTPEDVDTLEDLFEKEFLLYMKNISIFEDLIYYLEAEPITSDNEMELARIYRDAYKMNRVGTIDL